MKRTKPFILLIVTLMLTLAGLGNAWADRGHYRRDPRVGIYFGPVWDPWHYPPPYFYPPSPPIIIERTPPVYIEQPAPAAGRQSQSSAYWYYCEGSGAYYPYVKTCPGGWQRVSPTPADQP